MPSKKVFAKLIRRATQIVDPIVELNPWEQKNDTRFLGQGEVETSRLVEVSN